MKKYTVNFGESSVIVEADSYEEAIRLIYKNKIGKIKISNYVEIDIESDNDNKESFLVSKNRVLRILGSLDKYTVHFHNHKVTVVGGSFHEAIKLAYNKVAPKGVYDNFINVDIKPDIESNIGYDLESPDYHEPVQLDVDDRLYKILGFMEHRKYIVNFGGSNVTVEADNYEEAIKLAYNKVVPKLEDFDIVKVSLESEKDCKPIEFYVDLIPDRILKNKLLKRKYTINFGGNNVTVEADHYEEALRLAYNKAEPTRFGICVFIKVEPEDPNDVAMIRTEKVFEILGIQR